MLQRRRLIPGALAAPIASSRAEAQNGVPASTLSSKTIRELLAQYAGPGPESLGYVAGIGDAGGHRVISVGASGAVDQRALDGSSVFEIGSITKVFTALLMAEMAQRGEVSFDDPVAQYLPPEGRPHPYKDKAVTLIDLRPIHRACRGCRRTLSRRIQPVPTLVTRPRSFTRFCPRTRHNSTPAHPTSILISASACSATRSRCGRGAPSRMYC